MSGKLTIDNWPNLRILNVGDNALTGLVIKNCPELVGVIYSHNWNLNEESVIIEDCPNLETIFSYKSDKNELPAEVTPEERAHIEEELRRLLLLEEKSNNPQEEVIPQASPKQS